jgi:hypothetical protein
MVRFRLKRGTCDGLEIQIEGERNKRPESSTDMAKSLASSPSAVIKLRKRVLHENRDFNQCQDPPVLTISRAEYNRSVGILILEDEPECKFRGATIEEFKRTNEKHFDDLLKLVTEGGGPHSN